MFPTLGKMCVNYVVTQPTWPMQLGGGADGTQPLHFSAEQKTICGTETTFFENTPRKAISWVLENQNMRFSPPASTIEAPTGDTTYSTILAPSLWKLMPWPWSSKKLFDWKYKPVQQLLHASLQSSWSHHFQVELDVTPPWKILACLVHQ